MADIDFDYHLIDVLEQDARAVAEYDAGRELIRAVREHVQGKKFVRDNGHKGVYCSQAVALAKR